METRYLKIFGCIFLATVTLFIFWRIQYYDFVSFDDPLYVTDNPNVKTGLTLKSLLWSFGFQTGPNWIPLSWLSHIVDCQLYGLNPRGHHFNSLLLHVANAILLFLVLSRMTKSVWRSLFVSTLFAVHPLHVESVAWISERKDVLSTLFWMLTLWAYVRYVELPKVGRYFLALFFFVLGLMAKPMLVSLPFVLILLDYWPLERFDFSGKTRSGIRQAVGVIREKIPFFLFSGLLCVMTFLCQKGAGAVSSLDEFPLYVRVANALFAYVKYMGKMIWPDNLTVFYPHPGMLTGWQISGSIALLVCITFAAIKNFRSFPWFPVGWLWYLGTLFPVIGIVQVGLQGMADRYTYVPIIGLFIIVSWGLHAFLARFSYGKVTFGICGMALFFAFGSCTWFQIQYWQNDITLFTHALDVTTHNHAAQNNLGLALSREGKFEEAAQHFSKALKIRPQSLDYRSNMGAILAKQGKFEDAISCLELVAERVPDYIGANYNLGLAYSELGRFEEAIVCFKRIVLFNPQFSEAHFRLGKIMARLARNNEAIFHFSEAVRINPEYGDARRSIEILLRKRKAKKPVPGDLSPKLQ